MKKQLVTFSCLLGLALVWTATSFATLEDRANTTHNVNQVGYYTTNIGQFMPFGGEAEKTLEYPINSGQIAIYRQTIMVGVPTNVISAASGRFEEFDAIGGYHNRDNGKIATSDDPSSWPLVNGSPYWPVRDENDDPLILSQQDSYCVYSDSTNWRYLENGEADALLDLRVHQSIYSWGVRNADKFHIMKFEVENMSSEPYEDFYFNFYSDIDVGGIEDEWTDDCVGFDKDRELVWFYDADNFSDDWGIADPFMAGVTVLETPNDQGITDFHWIDVAVDEVAVNNAVWDSVSYNLMRSNKAWFDAHPDFDTEDYFHLGDTPLDGDHFDDPATSRITDGSGNLVGGPMVAYLCNGPVDIQPGESATWIVAVVVGDDEADLMTVTDQARALYDADLQLPVPPQPTLATGTPSTGTINLQWSNDLDITYQNPISGENDLVGYKLYRTTDPTLSDWEELGDFPMEFKGDTQVRDDAYSYSDSDNITNGFTYYYNLTSYRISPIDGMTEESLILADIDNIDNQPNALAVKATTGPGLSAADLDLIKVVPNPYVISADWDVKRLGNVALGEPTRTIAFTHLPTPSTVRIFTVDGDLIQTLQHTEDTGRAEWNLLTSEQRPVVSGLYFYHVESSIGEKMGRFAIIR